MFSFLFPAICIINFIVNIIPVFAFQLSLNIDQTKEKLEIQYQIYILMKKVTILRKILAILKTSAG